MRLTEFFGAVKKGLPSYREAKSNYTHLDLTNENTRKIVAKIHKKIKRKKNKKYLKKSQYFS